MKVTFSTVFTQTAFEILRSCLKCLLRAKKNEINQMLQPKFKNIWIYSKFITSLNGFLIRWRKISVELKQKMLRCDEKETFNRIK